MAQQHSPLQQEQFAVEISGDMHSSLSSWHQSVAKFSDVCDAASKSLELLFAYAPFADLPVVVIASHDGLAALTLCETVAVLA